MNRTHVTADNFNTIWRRLLDKARFNPDHIVESRGGNMYELENVSFTLTDPQDFLVNSKARDFNHDFAQKFFDWIMAGKTDPSELFGSNPNAKNFAENEGRNTAYGPRILKQLDPVLKELASNPGSRRAVISILEGEDCELLGVDTKMEFPCTESINFRIRNGSLDMVVKMRSNCACKTVCYDTYNFTHLMMYVYDKLVNDYDMVIGLGTYNVQATSYHFFERDLELVNSIIAESSKDS